MIDVAKDWPNKIASDKYSKGRYIIVENKATVRKNYESRFISLPKGCLTIGKKTKVTI